MLQVSVTGRCSFELLWSKNRLALRGEFPIICYRCVFFTEPWRVMSHGKPSIVRGICCKMLNWSQIMWGDWVLHHWSWHRLGKDYGGPMGIDTEFFSNPGGGGVYVSGALCTFILRFHVIIICLKTFWAWTLWSIWDQRGWGGWGWGCSIPVHGWPYIQ